MKHIKQLSNKEVTQKLSVALIGFSTLFILLYCFKDGINGNDFWWHIKVGEWIWENKTIPQSDIFSWYAKEQQISWMAHEWLSELIFYGIHHIGGDAGVYIFCLVAAIILVGLMWKKAYRYLANNILCSGLFFCLFAVVVSSFCYGRPHLFSYFLLFLELNCLYSFWENHNSKKIYWIPVIACLWANLHGGSSNLSYLLSILFFIIGVIPIRIGRITTTQLDKKSVKKLFIITIGAVLGLLVNPFGVEMLQYPYTNMADTFMLSIISEWQAPDAKSTGALICYFLPIVIMTMGFFIETKEIRLIDFLIMGAFLLLFLRSARFIMLWYISATFYAFPYMPFLKIKEIKTKVKKGIVVGAIAILIIASSVTIGKIVPNLESPTLIKKVMSDEMIAVIKEDSPKKLFNDYNFGEALIYNDIEVFFDSRADMYAAEHLLEDGISLLFLEQCNTETKINYVDVEKLIERYEFDSIVILNSRPLYSYIKSNPDKFVSVFEDDTAGYFRIVK